MGTLDSVHQEQVQNLRDFGGKQADLQARLAGLRQQREALSVSTAKPSKIMSLWKELPRVTT